MLATPSSTAHRRRHSHKRSAAISGDFDLEFFRQQGPSIGQQLESQPIINVPTTPTTPTTSTSNNKYFAKDVPTLTITEPEHHPKEFISKERLMTSTPSPQKSHHHARINSWAHSQVKSKKNFSHASADYSSSSSNETTPDLKRQTLSIPTNDDGCSHLSCSSPQFTVPEAKIDLDLASCIYRDPSSITKPGNNNNTIFHRRTESAPELEDFLKYKVFSKELPTKNSRKNSAIYEEEEESEEAEGEEHFDALSSASSSISQFNHNPSMNSLNSGNSTAQQHLLYSKQLQSPTSTHHSITSTPTSSKTNTTTRRGASATRYQSYYNNNILLSNALKSSDNLSQVIAHTPNTASSLHKSSISSFNNAKEALSSSSSSVTTASLHSPIPQHASRFKFESQVYDMLEKPKSTTSKPASVISELSTPAKERTSSIVQSSTVSKSHKKSNSLLKSFSAKIRRNSASSSSASISATGPPSSLRFKRDPVPDQQIDDVEMEGDSTLTPFDLGEPGPALDLTTMTPKYHDDYNGYSRNFSNGNTDDMSVVSSPSKGKVSKREGQESAKKSRMTFFGWRKK